jgi:hypothetical protein
VENVAIDFMGRAAFADLSAASGACGLEFGFEDLALVNPH